MALTPEEELELAQLEQEQTSILSGIDELKKEFQPIEEPKEIKKPSMLEAGARGVAQGLTFEMADELAARAESALTDKPYEQALEESREAYKSAEEEYPITTGIGGIAGGLAQGIGLTALSGGAAAPAAATSAASRLAKIGQLAKAALVPSAKKGAMQNIASAATTGAIMGGLTGVGASEEEGIEALKEAPTSALSGAAIGGALGGVVEGAKGVLGAAGKAISKGVEEGKYPTFVKMMSIGKKLGEEGKEFISEASQKRPYKEVLEVVEKEIIPEIKQALDDSRTVRNFLIAKSPTPVDVQNDLLSLAGYLKSRPELGEENKIAQNILKIIDNKTKYDNVTGRTFTEPSSALEAFSIKEELEDLATRDLELSAETKKALFGAAKSIKDKVDSSIDSNVAFKILEDNPELKATFQKILERSPKTNTEQLQNPIKFLNSKMKNVLDASEILGNITPSLKSEAQRLKDVQKIFKNIVSQPKDTSSGFLSEESYKKAMDSLRLAFPDMEKRIQGKVQPILEELDFQRYIEGSGLDRGVKEGGLIKKTVGDVARLAAEGVNIASSASSAARRGTAGPIPLLPTSSILKPEVSLLSSIKNQIDKKISTQPNNKTFQMLSDSLQSAIDQQDEVRRAAIINTLMQYPTFRESINKFRNPQEEEK
jgi:hypothetical protein